MSCKYWMRAYRDIFAAFRMIDYWYTLAWKDVGRVYARTKIGLLWLPISQGIFISVLGILYSQVLRISPAEFIPYLSAGIICWNLLRSVIIDGSSCLISKKNLLLNTSIPPAVLVLRMVMRHHIAFFLVLPVHVVVLALFGVEPDWPLLLAPLGIFLIFVNSIWVGILLSFACSRYRDLVQLVANIMQPMFFVTPIIWMKGAVGRLSIWVADINPFYHFVEIVRAPLLMKVPDIFCYVYVFTVTALGLVMLGVFHRFVSRGVVYWL